jgi:hypothetical protein
MSLDRKSHDLDPRSRARAAALTAPGPGKRTLTASLPDVPTWSPPSPVLAASPAGAVDAGDRRAPGGDAGGDLEGQGASSASGLEAFAGPAVAAKTGAPVQRQQAKGAAGAGAGACNLPFPKTEYDTPTGKICRKFDGVTNYKAVTEDRLKASGYKFWTSDGRFDKWVRIDGSSELWVQLPKINAATSAKAISALRSIVATRKAQLDELAVLAKLLDNPDPDVAAAAREDWDERMAEFPGFDDDYEQVPKLREQVDADHRKAFEEQVEQLMEQRDRYDPQSTHP